MAVTKHSHRK